MFGEITNSEVMGGWTFKLQSADKMPQDLATAFYKVLGDRFGAAYTPEFLVGTQLVNGLNYKLVVKRKMLVSGGKFTTSFGIVVINIPADDVGGSSATLVSESDASDFVLRDGIETGVKKALSSNVGISIKPLLELGTGQIVKGENYIFICECAVIYPGAEPYLAKVVVNNFQDSWNIVEIEKL